MASPIAFHPRYSEEPFDGFAGIRCHLVHNVGGAASVGVCTKEDQRYRTVTMGGLSRMLQSWNWPVSPAAADLLQQREHHRVSSLLNATNKREGKSKRKNESVIATETTTTTTSGRVRKGVCIKHTHTHYTLLETHIKDLPKGHGFRKVSGWLNKPKQIPRGTKGHEHEEVFFVPQLAFLLRRHDFDGCLVFRHFPRHLGDVADFKWCKL